MYAILNNNSDTILIGSKIIEKFNAQGTTPVTFDWLVPDTVKCLEVLTIIDPDGEICEFCKNNNLYSTYIPLKGVNWILDVQNNPNPVDYKTEFSYFLPREVSSLRINIYSISGIEVKQINNCPTGIGYHTTVPWSAVNNLAGTYLYKIIGINSAGGEEIYYGKLVKH